LETESTSPGSLKSGKNLQLCTFLTQLENKNRTNSKKSVDFIDFFVILFIFCLTMVEIYGIMYVYYEEKN